ncbi:hypothetical protein DLJ48_06895 [Oenococcus sicerae]|uniref:Prophage protein n=1 Tax=Oenococcus sicerae TaxID=2203724 RepID=A0ABX5QN98_9LACO|nr:DUF6711 family protein [Oenococcus sicerae]QAS70266.1 hypothetical protein DLJ48_06895 [Oenococcus sicerae]
MTLYYLAIGGTQVKSPQTLTWVIQDIDAKASRDSNGTMHRDRIASKIKLTVKWGPLTVTECKAILTAISGQFFSCTYLDAQAGGMVTKQFYVGDRTAPVYTFNEQLSQYVWTDLEADFIEQ